MASRLFPVIFLHLFVNSQQQSCPPGWLQFQTSCYDFILDAPNDWTESEYLCSLLGAHLVEIETSQENNFVKGQAQKLINNTHVSMWIGGTDIEKEGEFRWMTSHEKFDFTDWHPGNPSDSNHHEDCVHLWYDYHYKQPLAWNDINCSNKYPFICEKSLDNFPGEVLG